MIRFDRRSRHWWHVAALILLLGPGNPAVAGFQAATTSDIQTQTGGLDCTCTRTYLDGTVSSTPSCTDYVDECQSLATLAHCQVNPGDPACSQGLATCECDCEGDARWVYQHEPEDGVFLAGIPNVWQHDTYCNGVGLVVGQSPVGCGPIAIAMLMYWYEQQGYAGLAARTALDASVVSHEWTAVAWDVAELQPNLCAPRATATLPGNMAPAIEDYVDLYGSGRLAASVSHWKICEDCNVNAPDERHLEDGLEIIQAELEAGRPLILGFNHTRAGRSSVVVDGELVFTGPLSNSTPAIGTITHYGLITGFRRTSDGRDVIYLNMGQTSTSGGSTADFAFEWNPAGKWVHLYTMSLDREPTGSAWCPMDGFFSRGDLFGEFTPLVSDDGLAAVVLSHIFRVAPGAPEVLTPTAGSSCGVARGGSWVLQTPWFMESHVCAQSHQLPQTGSGVWDPNTAGGTSANPWYIDPGPVNPIQPGP